MAVFDYTVGHLILQPHRQVLDGGQRVALGSKALALLSVLAEAEGALVTKDELMAAVWPGVIIEENAIQVHVAALRKAMGVAADRLTTVRGVGYRLETGECATANGSTAMPVAVPESTIVPVLAVLPFNNLSSDAEMNYFSDGVSEEILGRLTRGSKLRLVGRTSSFQFRGSEKAGAAALLGASHVLDGSVQRANGRVRISAHLIESATQANLWSDHYDRGLEDIFAVQDEISEAIAEALNSAFFPIPMGPISPAVYDLYLRAKARVTSVPLMERNIASLEKVTEMAPEFAAGWGTLAYRRAELMMHSPYQERPVLRAIVKRDMARCQALDPGYPDAMAAGWVVISPFGAFQEQDDALSSNVVADRDHVDFLTARAYFLECVGRGREAAKLAGEAMALDSLNPFAVGMRGQALWRAGEFAEGRAVMEYVREQWPDSHHTVAVLIQACVHAGDWAAVDRLIEPARLALYPLREHVGVIPFARVMRNPSPRNRRNMWDAIRRRAESSGHIDAQVAVIAAEIGFVDEVYDLLDRARLGPGGSPQDVMGTHAYRSLLLFPKAYAALRSDPRFVQICSRVGLADYWLASQNWPDCADDVLYDIKSACASMAQVTREQFAF